MHRSDSVSQSDNLEETIHICENEHEIVTSGTCNIYNYVREEEDIEENKNLCGDPFAFPVSHIIAFTQRNC